MSLVWKKWHLGVGSTFGWIDRWLLRLDDRRLVGRWMIDVWLGVWINVWLGVWRLDRRLVLGDRLVWRLDWRSTSEDRRLTKTDDWRYAFGWAFDDRRSDMRRLTNGWHDLWYLPFNFGFWKILEDFRFWLNFDQTVQYPGSVLNP